MRLRPFFIGSQQSLVALLPVIGGGAACGQPLRLFVSWLGGASGRCGRGCGRSRGPSSKAGKGALSNDSTRIANPIVAGGQRRQIEAGRQSASPQRPVRGRLVPVDTVGPAGCRSYADYLTLRCALPFASRRSGEHLQGCRRACLVRVLIPNRFCPPPACPECDDTADES